MTNSERDPESFRRAPWLLLLAAPAALYVAVALYWDHKEYYPITGDEPHYLVIADSLWRDSDADVENNYAINAQLGHIAPGLAADHALAANNGLFSVHNIGLPLVLAIPFGLGGVVGARAGLALLLGLLAPAAFYAVFRRTAAPRSWAMWLSLCVCCGMPFVSGANQLYPDLLSGLALLAGASLVARQSQQEETPPWRDYALVALCLTLLPWLHIKNAAPMVIVILGLIAWAPRGEKAWRLRGRWLAPAAAAMLSLGLLAWYNHYAFGRFGGPYHDGALVVDPRRNLLILFGLHWDQFRGLFVQQPLFLLGILGLAAFWRRRPGLALWWVLLYLSVCLPNALHPNWYGGWSFAGRFLWTCVPLWAFPLAHGATWLMEHRPGALKVCCATAVALQVWLADAWLSRPLFLVQKEPLTDAPNLAPQSLAPEFAAFLPSFISFGDYVGHWPNYAALLLGTFLFCAGLRWAAGRRLRLGGAWLALLLAASVATLIEGRKLRLRQPPEVSVAGFQLPGQVGRVEGNARVAQSGDPYGLLSVGPSVPLPAGGYQAELRYASSETPGQPAGTWHVMVPPEGEIASGQIAPATENGGVLRFDFSVPNRLNEFPVHLRVAYPGAGTLSLQRLSIRPHARRVH